MSRLKNKGFTLLEVMIAVTILSVGLVMVVRSFVTSLRAIKISHNFLVANLLLEEKIWRRVEEQARDETIVPEPEDEGKFDPPFDDFNYKINFDEQDLGEPSSMYKLYKGTFEVSWQQREKKWSTSCATYTRSKE